MVSEPFKAPAPDSVWNRTIFKPTYDPFDVLTSAFHVKTKAATTVAFNPFRTQRLFVERMGLRNVEVKPRQVGASTLKLGLMTALSITTPNLHQLVITHREDTTETMRDTIRNFITWVNDYLGMGIELRKDNEEEMQIKTTGSAFYFGSSTAPGVGRSRTIHVLLGSELAHWQGPDPGKELGGMTESIPDGGLIFLESTPNGAEGPFYDIYNAPDADLPEFAGVSGEPWTKHFFPWFLEPSRRINLKGRELHLKPDELRLVTMHKLSHEQIAWRRWKWAQLESAGMYFPQEYPEDDKSCFTAGLRSVFPMLQMTPLFDMAQGAHYGDINFPGDPQDPGGVLRVWEDPRPGLHYVATGDVGGGHRDGDLSYLIVRCKETGRHVASLRGHWNPERFGLDSVEVAIRYNNAYLSHEANGLGEAAVRAATVTRRYANYHMEVRGAKAEDTKNTWWEYGFNVSPAKRTQMLTRVVEEVSNGRFHSMDEILLRQMTSARFERVRIRGGWGDAIVVPQSVHDDGLMALAQNLMLSDIVVFNDASGRAKPVHGV